MIVVTGATGFIGSNLVAELNAAGVTEILIVDTLGVGEKWRNIAKRQFDDIIPPAQASDYLRSHRKKIGAVFHMGANSSTTAQDGDLILATNLKSSMDYWHFCSDARVPLLYASSAATYGDGRHGFDDEADAELLRPLNLYGWSKQAFDLWAQRQASQGYAPPKWAGFKFFNVYGPNEYHKSDMMSLVAKNYEVVATGNPVRLFKSKNPDYADGMQLRDFVYVKDCCHIMMWFLRVQAKSGIYNIGTGEARSFIDLVNAISSATSVPSSITYVDLPAELEQRYQYFTEAKMQKLLGQGYNQPMTKLEDGVADYVKNYLSQNDRYR